MISLDESLDEEKYQFCFTRGRDGLKTIFLSFFLFWRASGASRLWYGVGRAPTGPGWGRFYFSKFGRFFILWRVGRFLPLDGAFLDDVIVWVGFRRRDVVVVGIFVLNLSTVKLVERFLIKHPSRAYLTYHKTCGVSGLNAALGRVSIWMDENHS